MISVLGALLCLGIPRALGGTLSFCDGNVLIEKTREQCGAGITFGDNKPDCICMSGIYRFIADSCETADGFAETVCTKLGDENGLGASIMGVKFTRDPQNWAQTGVVTERKGFGTETWDFITERHARGSTTKSGNVYAVNGKAYMATGRHDKQALCVEAVSLPHSERICRYKREDNEDLWGDGEVEIVVKGKCDGNSKPLKAYKCFGVLNNTDSECTLSCSPKSTLVAQVMPLMGRSFGLLPSNNRNPVKKSKGTGPTFMLQGRSMGQIPPALAPAPSSDRFPDEDPTHPVEYWKHDNKFLNRKMMIHYVNSKLSKNKSKKAYGEPKRTFELFDMMKNITTKYCPNDFVRTDWVNQVIQLFYAIHKGNIFKYDEMLSEGEFEWIKDILTKCEERVITEGSVDLTGDPNLPDPDQSICHRYGGGKATGFCNGTVYNSSTGSSSNCKFIPVLVPEDRANDSYHYVPEAAWNIVDIIQVVCFPEFNVSYRMFHVLEQAAEKLFTLQVKNLWYYPYWSERTKKRLLGYYADTQMHNMEVCIFSAYFTNGQIPRLVRPKPVKYLRKKRSAGAKPPVSEGQLVDVFCSKSRKEFVAPLATTCPQL